MEPLVQTPAAWAVGLGLESGPWEPGSPFASPRRPEDPQRGAGELGSVQDILPGLAGSVSFPAGLPVET